MKKNLISIMILALLIVNIVLTSIMMISVISTNKKTAALVTDVASAISIDLGVDKTEEAVKEVVPMKNVVEHTIGEMTIPLKQSADGTDHAGVLSFTLSMNIKHKDYKTFGEDIASKENIIKGEIIDSVGQYTIEEASTDSSVIEDDVLSRIQKLFDSDFIFDVTLSKKLYQ